VYQRDGSAFTTGAAPILPPDAYFFSVEAAGRQIGISSITIDTLSDGVQITERTGLDIPLNPNSTRSQYTTQYTIGTDLRLRDFRITVPGLTAPVVLQGTVEGDTTITISPGTGAPRWHIPVGTRSLMPPLIAPVVLALQQKLKRGERLEVPVFDPTTLTDGTISLAVLDDSTFLVPDSADFDSTAGAWVPAHSDTLRAWKLAWSNGSARAEIWVDSRGLPIRTMSETGFSLDRSAFEIVTINYRRRGLAPDTRGHAVIPRTAIARGVEPARGTSTMRVRIRTGLGPWSPLIDRTAATQTSEGDETLVTRAAFDSTTGSASDSSHAAWLRDEPLLGLGDSGLVNRARAILGPTRDPRQVAERLAAWVSQNIARVPDPLVPRAATVLRERQADVDGHTLLFVALARAAGLPARPVSGILLADGKFYLHSWAEVFLGSWVPVDPTWGEFPASANRVRMATGTLARPMDLLPLVAGLEAEVITFTQQP
jgi:transglutaminase-like putative cysteine protease